ncbi:spore germination protein [Salipaludibacillus aurantiacus]|uniref:Spore germination protein KA n=1 Tax=Salipaludibacillus aurantiacus TaxID=1601833 RepID=A0A1H9RGF0_9BACI|nr:spore germination protein [Salipaludibacillus aurantiacus]SER71880.1 spore germination protein KA [Salipaludibacillus aurantiacus]
MKLLKWFKRDKSKTDNDRTNPVITDYELPPYPAKEDMAENKVYLKETLNYTEDLIEKPFTIDAHTCSVMFLESLTDEEKMEKNLYSKLNHVHSIEALEDTLKNMDASKLLHVSEAVPHILAGKCLLFIDGLDYCYTLNTNKIILRDIGQPENEQIIRGAHQGFVESLMVNIYLLRQMVQHPQLTIRFKKVGEKKNTKVCIVHVEGIADKKVLNEIDRRLSKIDSDKLISSGVIEEYLEDFPYSPFPQFMSTERPDRCALNLLDGKIVLFVEGEGTALLLPMSFLSFYQSNDDYNSRWYAGTFFRLLRMFSFVTSVTLPGIYIAIISFHFEIIPYGMTFVIKDAVEEIPYPPIVEAFFMELTLELIREAGVRLPSPIGQTIGIVGGLVIGDAVVNAGFVSSVMIIVVALTAISSFAVPANEMSMSVRLLRFPIMIMASLLGFLGIVFCLNIYLIHLCKLTSLGKPYFYPFAPFHFKGILKDVLRFPHTKTTWLNLDNEQNNNNQK